MAPGQLPDPTAQLLLLDVFQRHGPPLGTVVLTRQTACTALGNPKSILQNNDSSAATFRVHLASFSQLYRALHGHSQWHPSRLPSDASNRLSLRKIDTRGVAPKLHGHLLWTQNLVPRFAVVRQLITLREQRGWSQRELADSSIS